MSRRGLVLSALNIREGEEKAVGLMVGHAFFMGVSTVFFETAASALFLARFGGELLPYVYIAGAVINTLTGVVYTRLGARVPFARLMSGTLVLLLAVVCGLRIGLAIGEFAALVFFLLIWYRVLSIATDLEYWAVAARLFDVRQSKRLFSLIGVGEVVARITGSFSVPLLVGFVGVTNLLLVSAVGLTLSLVFLLVVLRVFRSRVADPVQPRKKETGSGDMEEGVWARFRKLLDDRYLTLIFVLAVAGVFGKYFVDFAFLAQMESRYQDVDRLASFFAVFSGSVQVLNLFIRMFVSGRVLRRFGIQIGLLVLPAIHTLCCILIVVGEPIFGVGAIFWLVIANQGIYKTLKHPIDNPSFKILYQPLKKDRRLAAQIAVEMVVTPITIGVAGLVMLLFSTVIPFSPVVFAYVMLVTFAAWGVAAVLVYRQYSVALTRALSKRFFDDDAPFSVSDEKSIALVRNKLKSTYPGDVVFALDLLEKADHASLPEHLLELLEHADGEVRRYVLLKIEDLRPQGALAAVRQRIETEELPLVKAAALRAMCALMRASEVEEVAVFLDAVDPAVREGAMIGLLRRGPSEGAEFAERRLGEWAASEDPGERLLATRVIGEVGSSELGQRLRGLLDDEVVAVGRGALRAAGRIGDPQLWPEVAGLLNSRHYRRGAALTLGAAGETALPVLEKAFDPARDRESLVRVAQVVGFIRGPRATAFLSSKVDYPDETVRREVLKALRGCGNRVTGRDAVEIRRRIGEEAADAAWKLAAIVDLAGDEQLSILRAALVAEVEQNRERIFYLLSFVFDRTSIERAHRNFGAESQEKRAYALEIVDVTLPKELKAMVLPLLSKAAPEEGARRLGQLFPQSPSAPWQRVVEVLGRPDGWMDSWARRCAAYCAAGCDDPEVRAAVEAYYAGLIGGRTDRAGDLEPTARTGVEAERQDMLTVERVIILKTVNLFSQIPEEVLAEVADTLEEQEFAAGEVVFDKGDLGDALYIIASGKVRVYDGDKTINVLGEREIFGELAAFDPEPRSASIAAEEASVLFRLDREALFELMADRVDVAQAIVGVICQRLRRMTNIAMSKD